MDRGFWANLQGPVVALAPMDGVTDAAYRYMVCKKSRPAFTMTEFTNVEGLARGADKMMVAFLYHEIERPVVAQIYGVEIDSFYKCAVMLSYLGFDGIDINMGCPANKVAKKGSGAGLIKTPELAKKIVLSTKKAAQDWANGITLEEAGVHQNIIAVVKEMRPVEGPRVALPVSVKTRIGYEKPITEEWINHLLEVQPANISLHGRTLKQMYMGLADWEEIAKGARLAQKHGISLMGNGDVQSFSDAESKIKDFGLDGVLVGRATFGNPFFFSGVTPTIEESLITAIEHAEYLWSMRDKLNFMSIRKHLAWYCKGFDGAREMRKELIQVNEPEEVKKIIFRHFPNLSN